MRTLRGIVALQEAHLLQLLKHLRPLLLNLLAHDLAHGPESVLEEIGVDQAEKEEIGIFYF